MLERFVGAPVIFALLVVGCGATGATSLGDAGPDAGDAAVVATFKAVTNVLVQHCTLCHAATNADALPDYPKLSLVPADAYAALVNAPAHEPCGGTLVVPGSSATSYLMHKLLDDTPCDGLHMPRSFEGPPATPLTAAELTTIRRWIDDGAAR